MFDTTMFPVFILLLFSLFSSLLLCLLLLVLVQLRGLGVGGEEGPEK